MDEPGCIRVMCADDHGFIVAGLRSLVEAEPDMRFVGAVSSLDLLAERVLHERPDVLLIDIEMPGPDVFDVLCELRGTAPDLRIVLFSAHVRDRYIDSAIACGAAGYLSKTDDPGETISAIRRVSRGERVFGAEILPRVREPGSPAASAPGSSLGASRLHLLSQREQQILRLIGKGWSRSKIADAIHRSPKTVDAHRASIMEKLGIHSRVELARYAIREGLVEV